jgi:hypothetical protein
MTTYSGVDSYASALTIPDDTAAPTAANLLVSIEGALDRTTFLKNRTGTMRVVNEGATAINDLTDALPVITLGGNPATFNTTGFGAVTLPLAGVATLVGDEFEFEIAGTIQGTAVAGGAFAKVTVIDGTPFDVPGAKVYGRLGAPQLVLQNIIDGAGGYGVVASWTGTDDTGAYSTVYTVAGLKAGDLVDLTGWQMLSLSSTAAKPSTHTGQIEMWTQENAGAFVLEPGARDRILDIAATNERQSCLRTVHQMVADGSLTVAVHGRVDAIADSATVKLQSPISYKATVLRRGYTSRPVSLAGRYTATTAGTLAARLDGRCLSSSDSYSWVGSFVCKWRLWRVNP